MNVRTETVYHEIARRLLLKQSDDEIAQQMGFKIGTLKRILEKQDFRVIVEDLRARAYGPIDKELSSRSEDLATRIRDDASESYDRLRKLLIESPSEAIQRDVAMDLLDRAGYGKQPERPSTVINIGALETSVLVEALRREREAHELNVGKDPLALTKPVRDGIDERRAEDKR